MKKFETKEITTIGVFGAIILLLSLVPAPWSPATGRIVTWGFFGIGPGIEVTIIHIPVIVGAIFGGKRVAISLGAIFGIGSFLAALFYGAAISPFAIFFLNPFVSILPRVLFGYFIYLFYTFIAKQIKNNVASMMLSFAISTFVHSIMVLTMLYLFSFYTDVYTDIFGSLNIIRFMLAVIGVNAVFEIIVAVLVGTPVGLRVKEFKELNKN